MCSLSYDESIKITLQVPFLVRKWSRLSLKVITLKTKTIIHNRGLFLDKNDGFYRNKSDHPSVCVDLTCAESQAGRCEWCSQWWPHIARGVSAHPALGRMEPCLGPPALPRSHGHPAHCPHCPHCRIHQNMPRSRVSDNPEQFSWTFGHPRASLSL